MHLDSELVARCREELPYATDAFELLMHKHRQLVYRTCVRLLGSIEEAEEASQDVFVRVFSALPRFEGRSSFRTWLYRIVINVCNDRRASAARRREKLAEYELGSAPLSKRSSPPSDDTMARALEELSPEDREALVLRHVAELETDAIAETLGVGVSAAKMRVSRATTRLRQIYDRIRDENS